jgi:glc operon protein GlcG
VAIARRISRGSRCLLPTGAESAILKDGRCPGCSPDLAIGKARTSALLQWPSAETESAVNDGRPAFATSGLMTLRGGAPLMAGAEVVGAVGIASLDKDNDVKIAQAAAAAFASLSPGQPAARADPDRSGGSRND